MGFVSGQKEGYFHKRGGRKKASREDVLFLGGEGKKESKSHLHIKVEAWKLNTKGYYYGEREKEERDNNEDM